MGADVITLDGLPTHADRKPSSRPCGKLVEVYLGVLDQKVRVCERDMAGVDSAPKSAGKRGRGRPKGSTVKLGAKAPRVKECTAHKVVARKDGRKICRCSDRQNSRILKNEICGI